MVSAAGAAASGAAATWAANAGSWPYGAVPPGIVEASGMPGTAGDCAELGWAGGVVWTGAADGVG
jgi:hypothetical protein